MVLPHCRRFPQHACAFTLPMCPLLPAHAAPHNPSVLAHSGNLSMVFISSLRHGGRTGQTGDEQTTRRQNGAQLILLMVHCVLHLTRITIAALLPCRAIPRLALASLHCPCLPSSHACAWPGQPHCSSPAGLLEFLVSSSWHGAHTHTHMIGSRCLQIMW